MSTNKRDPKGDRRTVRLQQTEQSPTLPQEQDQLIGIDVALDEANRELGKSLQPFSDWDHGYLKMRRSPLGSDLHLTWTWTLGSHSGSYVYVRVEYWRLAYGLQLLAHKIWEVTDGRIKPTPDKRNPSHNSA